MIRWLMVAVSWGAVWLAGISAAEQPQGLGQLLIRDAQSDSPVRLNVARYHVHVVLQPPVALVQVDQSFYNPFPRQQEGTFVFNLPLGASVSRFAMYVTPSELIEGELIERQRAARIYQSIVDRQRDPAILEQIGDNLFKVRVFPIFAKDEKRILLDFTLPLESFDNLVDFRLPLLSDLAPIWDFRITGTVHGTGVRCLSHPAMHIDARDDGTKTLDFGQQNYRPETDLVLSFKASLPATTVVEDSGTSDLGNPAMQQPSTELTPSLRSYRTQARRLPGRRGGAQLFDPAATYFLVQIPPPTATPDPPPVDVLLLADTSSGIGNLERVRDEIRRILEHLRPDDRFRLFGADVSLRPMHDQWRSPDDEQIASALERFEQEFCLGGTDMQACLHEAVEAFDQTGEKRQMVIYVGDGADPLFASSSVGAAGQHFWQRWHRQTGADFAGILVQHPPDGAVPVSASAGTHGLWFDLAGDITAQRQRLHWLQGGLPSPQPVQQVEVVGADSDELFWPGAWAPGRTLTIYGRTLQPGPIELSMTLGGGEQTATHTWTLSADDDADDVFVGRLWAQRRLDRLRQMGTEDEQQRAEIIALSQEWSLLSPLTAFLVLETEADYKRWQIDRQIRRRYWKPPEARSDEPLPAHWLAEVMPPDPPSTPRERPPQPRKPSPVASVPQVGKLPFDPLSADRWELRPSFAALVGSAFRGSPDFLRRHPHAQTLLQPANLIQLADGCTLDEFASRLSEITGVPVMLDKRALDFLGIEERARIGRSRPRLRTAPTDPWPVDSRWLQTATISLRSGIRHLLEPLELVMIEEPYRLLITSVDAVVGPLVTEIYPVEDLVYTDRLPALWTLSDPYLDRDERSRRRLDAKLRQPVTADLEDIPLQQAVDQLAGLLGETIVLDRRARALDDIRISADRQINMTLRDIPAREALRWMLHPLDLDWEIRDEAIVITSADAMRSEVRLYSGKDLVFEYPADDWTGVADPRWQKQGMGGGLGGFSRRSAGDASRGFSGMGFGFGGGMGGMGGGMGGMTGPSGGTATPSAPPTGVALSSGGDGGSTLEADRGPERRHDSPFEEAREFRDSLASLPDDSDETRYEIDADPIIDLMTATVEPVSWEFLGGLGVVNFFPSSLHFVVSQTRPVHERVEALVERLRAMPPIAGAAFGGRPATVPWISSQIPGSADYDTLIEVITESVAPMEWEMIGGPGSIDAELLRAALVVDQSPQVHQQVQRLLTLLRRSRYESACGSRPWEAPVGGSAHGPVAAPRAGSDPGPLLRIADLPPPSPEQLHALQIRRDTDAAHFSWRRIASDGPASVGTIRRTGSWIECRLEHCTVRLGGDEAAVYWPSLQLVELGKYAESLRRGLDAQLPWMPHRTNEELARWFDVRRVQHEAAEANDDGVWLQLVPIGLSRDGGSYLQIAYSNDAGEPIAWESYEAGNRVARIVFDERADSQADASGRTAVLRDADGKERIRWELTAADNGPSTTIPEKDWTDVADLTFGWNDCLVLDYRAEQPVLDAPLADALTAIRQFDWTGAVEQLSRLSADRGPHPLASLLEAWCLENAPGTTSRERQAQLLSEVARSGASGLMDFITEQHFPSLSRETWYAILRLQPEANRTAVDDDRLARAAVGLGRRAKALEHLRSASQRDQQAGAPGATQREAARQRLRLQLYLELSRFDEAMVVVDQWVAQHAANATALADVAELLARHAQPQRAEDVAQAALAIEMLDDAARYTLLLRLARWREGAERCRTLLEAAQLQPADSQERADCLQRLLAQLNDPTHAELAGWLATQTDQPDLQSALWIRQAELTRDTRLAAELFWRVQQSGRLDDGRLAIALRTWNQAGHAARVIEICEQRLRAGHHLPDGTAEHLATAYRAEHRPKDARRAATHRKSIPRRHSL